ncbi:FAD/NAD(P)-binding domain-containing protein [Hypoxylon trugodes]|uniref:FAD/NAD(P)-binding domain-containing protein n=1 Tax=Hypoxylon trugodes TaxID=326681 RepID=UPI0021A1758C|nr:FAD/NAD(P)-binding domain-containing protein [Hypoxylon trugodes]KAI1390323.1 FAD/NAD(P)-binding domain-containing protein [Hypoxylon trugodes]
MEDFASVQGKFAEEAQKRLRLRPEGVAQYETLAFSESDKLRHLSDDIWADHAALDAQTPPLASGDRPKFLIAGAGIGGLLAAVRLIQAGFSADQIRIIETAGGVGGTWYWNRYPGLHCDMEAYVYLPLLEEMGYMPSHRYAPGVEIRNYLNDVAKRWNIDDKILFRTKLDKLEWDESSRAWKVDLTTGRGPNGAEKSSLSVTAEFVWVTAGLLTKPKIAKLGGVGFEGFKGEFFHPSRWNYNVTGGSPEEAFPVLSKLKDKRVGYIGTGATAIQAVPQLAEYAKELYVFQRTPAAVFSRGQRPTDPEEWKKIAGKPGWYAERVHNILLHLANSAPPGTPNLVDDEWSRQPAFAALVGGQEFPEVVGPEQVPEIIAHFLKIDAPNTARLRKRVAEIVKDKETAEKLTPWYPTWCKRPTYSDMYLESFNKPNVHLVDTDGKGVESVTPHGLVANGEEFPLDIIVVGTGYDAGFMAGGDPLAAAGVKVFGREGKTIPERWESTGYSTLFGCATNGFPNFFWLSPFQAASTGNYSSALDTQASHIAYLVGKAHEKAGGLAKTGVTVEVEVPAQEAWSTKMMMGAARYATLTPCTPSYFNNEGNLFDPNATQEQMMKSARATMHPTGMPGFIEDLKKWREEDKLSGIKVTVA